MDKRLIFTVTPGRSGTGYLAAALDTLDNVTAKHEPDPNFRWLMREIQRAPFDRTIAFLQAEKLPAIEAEPGDTYVETSHLFCKGFIEPLAEMGVEFELVILTRPARDVALSLWRRQTIPGRTSNGWRYLLYPGDQVALQLPNWTALSDYQLCYWYALEIEARQQYYRENFPASWDLSFDNLINFDSLFEFALTTGIGELNREKVKAIGPLNQNEPDIAQQFPDGDLDELEAVIEGAVNA